jgi:hypothetical protein
VPREVLCVRRTSGQKQKTPRVSGGVGSGVVNSFRSQADAPTAKGGRHAHRHSLKREVAHAANLPRRVRDVNEPKKRGREPVSSQKRLVDKIVAKPEIRL